jgi:hypothetical protein
MKRFATILASAGLAAGCLSVTFTTTQKNEGAVVVKLGDLSGKCEGSATVTQETGTVTLTRTQEGDTCHLSADFSAEAVDMGALREKVEGEIARRGHNSVSADVVLKAPLTVSIKDIKLEGFEPPSTDWSVDVEVAEQSLFALDGADLSSLLTQDVSAELGEAQVQILNDLYQSGGVVNATGQFVLGSVPVSWIEALPAGGEATLSFTVGATVTANVTIDAGG